MLIVVLKWFLELFLQKYSINLSLFLAICRECRGKHEEKMSKESEWVRLKADTESVNVIADQ